MSQTRRPGRRYPAAIPFLLGSLALASTAGCDSNDVSQVDALAVAATMAKASIDGLGKLLEVNPPPEQCPEGGTVDTVCDGFSSTSVFSITFDICQPTDPSADRDPTINGIVEITVDDPAACSTMTTVGTAQTIFHYRDLSTTVAGADRELVERSFFAGAVVSQDLGGGSEALQIDGLFEFLSQDDQLDISMDARDLTLRVDPAGGGGEQITANGPLDLTQVSTGSRIRQVYTDYQLTQGVDNSGNRTVTIAGTSFTECIFDAIYTTVDPIIIASGESCPTAGTLEVTIGNQVSLIIFNSDGTVDLDRMSDGFIDRKFSSCDALRIPEDCQ